MIGHISPAPGSSLSPSGGEGEGEGLFKAELAETIPSPQPCPETPLGLSARDRVFSKRCVVAERLKPVNEASHDARTVSTIQPSGTEVFVRRVALEDVEDRDDELVRDGHDRLVVAPSRLQAVELVLEVGALCPHR